jgi:phosphopantetheine adenylyltransferase
MNAKVRIFEERYSGGILDMNIFCIMFVNENEMSNMKSSTVNTQSSKNQNQTRNANATMKNGSYFLNSINQ